MTKQKINTSIKVIEDNDIQKIISSMFDSIDSTAKKAQFKQEKKPQTIDETMRTFGIYDRVVKIYENNAKNNEDIKKNYSKLLLKTLIGQLIAMNLIFIAAGIGLVNYSESLMKLFLTGTFGEVVGLVVIIVKYLFKDNLSESLNIVLNNIIRFKNKDNYYKKNNQKETN